MQYRRAAANPLWGVALVNGRPGWTIVRTAPLDLLMEGPAAGDRMRLGLLAKHLGAPMLAHNVYDGTQEVLVEATADGEVFRSGFAELPGDDVLTYYGEPAITDDLAQVFFQRIDPRVFFEGCPEGEHKKLVTTLMTNPYPGYSTVGADDVLSALAYLTGDPSDNLVNVRDLIEARPLQVPGLTLYFADVTDKSRARP
jgi:hypothetical protein